MLEGMQWLSNQEKDQGKWDELECNYNNLVNYYCVEQNAV